MTLYAAARLLHIAGALGMFMAMGVDLSAIVALGRATTTGQARRALEGYRLNAIIGPLSLLLLLVPGIYMATTVWHWQPWLRVSMVTLVALFAVGSVITRRRATALAASLGSDERRLTAEEQARTGDPLVRTSFVVRAALAVGILALMSLKPDFATSVGVIVGALVAAAALSTPFWLRARASAAPQNL